MQKNTRALIERAKRGEDLTDDEMTDLYCEAPEVLRERDAFERGLRLVVEMADAGGSASDLRHLASRFLPSECPNCFEGKSDMDHTCPKCGGTGELNDPGEIAEGGPSHPCPCGSDFHTNTDKD